MKMVSRGKLFSSTMYIPSNRPLVHGAIGICGLGWAGCDYYIIPAEKATPSCDFAAFT